ncbi:uncharacterized protein BDZ83DRAFT_729042 [Colletotrichum acutatum]|uniref:Uncharacterized protein n=1 Tax=Glomerella acutata TaxID=27357 RepID=A0AAD8UT18_GLOAC|nr:uncharacterized protein BDZ83DRAFT_729042 [Colletotrichum acutatum]KAK1727238.1 hypothetical protein BDZ83DRAFT_729042 [Colletotrichum acutatum]
MRYFEGLQRCSNWELGKLSSTKARMEISTVLWQLGIDGFALVHVACDDELAQGRNFAPEIDKLLSSPLGRHVGKIVVYLQSLAECCRYSISSSHLQAAVEISPKARARCSFATLTVKLHDLFNRYTVQTEGYSHDSWVFEVEVGNPEESAVGENREVRILVSFCLPLSNWRFPTFEIGPGSLSVKPSQFSFFEQNEPAVTSACRAPLNIQEVVGQFEQPKTRSQTTDSTN